MQPHLMRSVNGPKQSKQFFRSQKKMKFPADAEGAKPNLITFIEAAGSGLQPPMSCVYSLTYRNFYDFGNFRAIIEEVGPNELKVKRLEFVD